MQLKHVLATSAAAITIGLAAPAAAQITEGGNGSADGNLVVTDGLDLLSNNNDSSNNSVSGSNQAGNDLDQSTTDNSVDGSNQAGNDLDQSTTTDAFDLLSNNNNGNNRENENYGAGSAGHGGSVTDSNNDNTGSMGNHDGRQYSGSNVAEGTSQLNQGSSVADDSGVLSQNSTVAAQGGTLNQNSNNGNSSAEIVATQILLAVNSNRQLDEVADFDGEDGTESSVGYNSGANGVNGSAFAAFAGILNQAWNTGINANAQAATNIAAQGSVSFGDTTGGGD